MNAETAGWSRRYKTALRKHLEQGSEASMWPAQRLGRQAAEAALKKSGKQRIRLLQESSRLQKHLRHLTREILSEQEDEQKKTSRRLHNEIVQTLITIDLRLLTLKKAANANTESLKKEIANTQQLVRKTAKKFNRQLFHL